MGTSSLQGHAGRSRPSTGRTLSAVRGTRSVEHYPARKADAHAYVEISQALPTRGADEDAGGGRTHRSRRCAVSASTPFAPTETADVDALPGPPPRRRRPPGRRGRRRRRRQRVRARRRPLGRPGGRPAERTPADRARRPRSPTAPRDDPTPRARRVAARRSRSPGTPSTTRSRHRGRPGRAGAMLLRAAADGQLIVLGNRRPGRPTRWCWPRWPSAWPHGRRSRSSSCRVSAVRGRGLPVAGSSASATPRTTTGGRVRGRRGATRRHCALGAADRRPRHAAPHGWADDESSGRSASPAWKSAAPTCPGRAPGTCSRPPAPHRCW